MLGIALALFCLYKLVLKVLTLKTGSFGVMARQKPTKIKIMLFTDDLHILLMSSYVQNSKPNNTFKDSFKTISQ